MKKILTLSLFLSVFIIAGCSSDDSGSSISSGINAKFLWSDVCVNNDGSVDYTRAECVTSGNEVLAPDEVCEYSNGILAGSECVYNNAERVPCGGTNCPLGPDGKPLCQNNPENCPVKDKAKCPNYGEGWQQKHQHKHGNCDGTCNGTGNGNCNGGGNGNGNGGNGNGGGGNGNGNGNR